MTRVGRIPYVNCYPVYGAIDRGVVPLDGELVNGVPTDLNRRMRAGELDISVVSAVEYARDSHRYLLLSDLAISCDGPVRSVMLFAKRPAAELSGRRVLVSRSSMTSVALLQLLFDEVWHAAPAFVPSDSEVSDLGRFADEEHDARLVIGDAALLLGAGGSAYPHSYDLGLEWKNLTGLPFVFAVWVAQRKMDLSKALEAHRSLLESRDWGIRNLPLLVSQAAEATGVDPLTCREYLAGLDYGLSREHLAGLTEFFRRLAARGSVPDASLTFLPAA